MMKNRKNIKTFLFTIGILALIMAIVGILFLIIKISFEVIPESMLYFLTLIGTSIWIIIPATIFLILKIKEGKKKLSDTQQALKSASIWGFVIIAFFKIINFLIN